METEVAQNNTVLPEEAELQKLNQEFQQKCFEAGRIKYNLDILSSRQAELEKTLEITERAVKAAGNKLNDLSAKISQPKKEIKTDKESH